MIESESWRAVVGYEGIYEVSSLGRVRSLDRIDARGWKRRQVILCPGLVRGYYRVVLHNKTGATKKVHRLVLEAFCGPCPAGFETRHRDGCWTNNHLFNLQWGSKAENLADKIKHGNIYNRSIRRSDGRIFSSVKDAAAATAKAAATNIVKCCREINKTAGGYGWEYI